jgi:hypothetical protein
MHDPREPHMTALSHILRYLQGTLNFGLLIHRSSTSKLVFYFDANWAGCPDTRRSTFRYAVFLCDNLVSWSSKLQNMVSRSNAKAEYRLLPMVLCRLVGLANYSWSCTPLCLAAYLSIWRPAPFSINSQSMSKLISNSSVTRSSLGKFTFCTSRRLLSSLTSSPRIYHLHSSLSFALLSTSVVARVGTGGVLELFIYLCCIIGTWASGLPLA